LSKYTFIKFITSCNRGSLVSWNGVKGSGGGKGRVPLDRKVPLGGRVPLSKRVAF
jgi:hypothetical protein